MPRKKAEASTETNEEKNLSQRQPAEVRYQEELNFLSIWDSGNRPQGWALTPYAVSVFINGSDGEKLKLKKGTKASKVPKSLEILPKFVGDRALVERSIVTLAGERGLILVGEPGTAKSMLSELLSAAISGDSSLTVQGTAGTIEDHLRYSWNYSLLLSKGYNLEALTPSVVLSAMRAGKIARVEEITRCLPEVQDALVSILSERRLVIPEISEAGVTRAEYAQQGFNVIATANLRDKGVSEMSAALKRRFNFENVAPISDAKVEMELIISQTRTALASENISYQPDEILLETLLTCFRDLRTGKSEEGWSVEKPTAVMSTAEAVSVACSLSRKAAFFSQQTDLLKDLPQYIKGVVVKDEPKDLGKLVSYWDSSVRQRAKDGSKTWATLLEMRDQLEK